MAGDFGELSRGGEFLPIWRVANAGTRLGTPVGAATVAVQPNPSLRLISQVIREPRPTNPGRNCPVFLRYNKVVTPVFTGVS